MKNLNKKAQVAETLTWVVATIIIVIILAISIFVSSLIPSTKSFSTETNVDLFAKQTLISYLLTKDSAGTVYNDINQNNLTDMTGNLAATIFKNLYGGYYNSVIYFGLLDNAKQVLGQQNKYFTYTSINLEVGLFAPTIDYRIKLNNGKYLQLILWHSS